MPFTLSHVAAVLPVRRRLLRAGVFTAAVIGSMVPDFGLFYPGEFSRWQTHSVPALFMFCLPVGLFTWWLTMWLVRPAALAVVPDRAYTRLDSGASDRRLTYWFTWVMAAGGVLFGAITHLLWDAFTHETARGVRMFPVLEEIGPDVVGHPLQLYRWLQYSSSVIGLLAVMIAVWLWWRHAPQPAAPPPNRLKPVERALWSGLYLLVPVLAVLWQVLAVEHTGRAPFSTAYGINREAIGLLWGIGTSAIVVSLLLRLRLLLDSGRAIR